MKSKHFQSYAKVARAIKEARMEKGLSQEELADKIGVSKSYISKIEAPNCDKSFSLEIMFEIACALQVPVRQLLKYLE